MIIKSFFKMFKFTLLAWALFSGTSSFASITSLKELDQAELNFRKQLSTEYQKAQNAFHSVKVNKSSYKPLGFIAPSDDSEYLELNRINVMVGVFVEIDLALVEFEIKPYVDLRFEK